VSISQGLELVVLVSIWVGMMSWRVARWVEKKKQREDAIFSEHFRYFSLPLRQDDVIAEAKKLAISIEEHQAQYVKELYELNRTKGYLEYLKGYYKILARVAEKRELPVEKSYQKYLS
jgi:hypothetical protein